MNIAIFVSVISLTMLTAVLSAAEGTLFALTRVDRESLRDDDRRSARTLRGLLESPKRLIFTLQVAGELGLVGVSLGITAGVIAFYGIERAWLAFVVAPPFLLLFCLLVPRAIASRHPRQTAAWIAIPLWFCYYFLAPLTWPLQWLSDVLMSLLGIPTHGTQRLDESEFRTLVDIGEKEGALREQERELINNVFEFGDIVASEVMTPRTEVVGFSINTPIERILERIKEERFSRVPIFKTNLDNVLGILYTKDLLALRTRGEVGKRTLKELLHPVYFVPVTKKIDELFREFQTQKIHLAVVVDEYGGVAGIVTMDDLLEELFGVMLDAHDIEEKEYIPLPGGGYRVQAHMQLEEFRALMGLELPAREEDVYTVGGYLLGLVGTLPGEGDVIRDGQLEFKFEKIEGTRLKEISVKWWSPEPGTEPGAEGEGRR